MATLIALQIEDGGVLRTLNLADLIALPVGAATAAGVQEVRDGVQGIRTDVQGARTDVQEVRDRLPGALDNGRLTVVLPTGQVDSDFKKALKFEPLVGEEVRRMETTTDDYHGYAPDGTPTGSASWRVVRFYKTAGKIVRARYRTGVAWDSVTEGWL